MISWNVNGLRACIGKGFLEYFKEMDADIFCIQESKLQEGQIKLDLEGYHQYWNYAEKKDILGLQFLRKKNLCQLPMESMWRSMIKRDVLSLQNIQIIM